MTPLMTPYQTTLEVGSREELRRSDAWTGANVCGEMPGLS
jgi:hypothetical protein